MNRRPSNGMLILSVVGTAACLAVIYWAANAKPTSPPAPTSAGASAPARDASAD